ncbi:MAG: TIGR04282 family arsenosugar biosynthesis glycosyltransferase [Pseudomonadota bacterium]|nr:TIGR04282 family arsenosugar biosynthesis glycosyltransferase [Pseudomonadota bacterium]
MTGQPDFQYPAGRILVFAKAPVAGEVKTRLAAHIGKQAAAVLYEQLVRDSVGLAAGARLAPVELHVASQSCHPLFVSLADRQAVEIRRQKGADLGQRMCNALKSALRTADFALLIGTDCPAMSADYLQQACQRLDAGSSVVLGPAEDGGYVLIGVRSCDERLFTDIPWSSDRVLQLTRARLQALKLPYAELDTLWDLDRLEDLRRWRTH